MQLSITQIRTDGGTQPRMQLDMAVIADYTEAMAEGSRFPPITVFYDGADYWLADGFHRLSAVQQLGLADVSADVRQGTLQDAQWHSYSVNQAHGLRRTNDDKRMAVEAALTHPYAATKSLREIASHCGVSHTFVSTMRGDTSVNGLQIDTRIVTRNGSTYEMDTANIGQREVPDGWRDRFYHDNEDLGLVNVFGEGGELIDIRPGDDSTSRMKPKINRAGDVDEPRGFDACQTPGYAIDPLLPYLPAEWTVWEPACGEGLLVEAFYDASRNVVMSDILEGHNFFTHEPDGWDVLVTNPPYSIKYQWLARCYELGRPFALLLPVETLGAQRAQALFVEYGIQIILLDKRINFKMPNIGWEGSSAQFPVAWFTWGLGLETQIVFGKLQCD